MDSPIFYKPPTRFTEVKTVLLKSYKPPTRYAEVKLASFEVIQAPYTLGINLLWFRNSYSPRVILIEGDLYIVIGWDFGTSIHSVICTTTESFLSHYRRWSLHLAFVLAWCLSCTSHLCEHCISLLMCELECLQFPTTKIVFDL